MPKWPWEKEEDDKKIELPKELEDKFTSVKTDVTIEVTKKIDERFASLQPVIDFAAQYKKDKEDAAAAEAEKERKKQEAANSTSDEDLAAELLTNPRKAISEATKSERALLLQIRADNVKREVFQDRAQDFPYYSGEIKTEIDKLISEQNLQFQNDPRAIENAYHTVVGRKMKDINEGKIKSRFASFSSTSTSGPRGDDGDKKTIKMTPDIERAARLTGMKPEDYIKALEADEEFDYAG